MISRHRLPRWLMIKAADFRPDARDRATIVIAELLDGRQVKLTGTSGLLAGPSATARVTGNDQGRNQQAGDQVDGAGR